MLGTEPRTAGIDSRHATTELWMSIIKELCIGYAYIYSSAQNKFATMFIDF